MSSIQLNYIKIENFRGLKEIFMPLSSFVCIIGENNCGKSSTLLALDLLINGGKITKDDYFDKDLPVSIEIELSNLEDKDLERIKENHRKKFIEYIVDNKIKLIREYNQETNHLLIKKLLPIDERFDYKNIDKALKGKKGKNIEDVMGKLLPEYLDGFKGVTTQSKAKEKVNLIIENMDPTEKTEKNNPLPSGIPESIKYLLPEPVYIAASKDLSDETKTSQSTTFGKLIKVILELIEDAEEFEDILQSFDQLKKLLNISKDENGQCVDTRINEMIEIETLLNTYLQENFPKTKIELKIPPPSLNKVFSGSKIIVNDGTEGDLELKGDGLKRAVIFALLRTYVEKNRQNLKSKINRPYLFLFEEPELYLHPSAQKILFEALCNLSKDHFVITTTHSPLFFSPDYTGRFIKMKRIHSNDSKPCAELLNIDLKDELNIKELFQIICYENNNAAFFSDKVLLVEGESDLHFFKFISKKLNPDWDFDTKNIPVIKIHGKGNAKRYKEFFELFGIKVHMILDLDILIKDFDKLTQPPEVKKIHDTLLNEIDKILEKESVEGDPTKEKVKELVRRYSWKQKYQRLKEIVTKLRTSYMLSEEEILECESLFSSELLNQRENVLKNEEYKISSKYELLKILREENIYVLSLGAVESYYPKSTEGKDKPSRALNACKLLCENGRLEEICPLIDDKLEFEIIFEKIFN